MIRLTTLFPCVIVYSICAAAATTADQHPAAAVRWDFGSEQTTPLQFHGNVQRDQPGPRPPEFPDMPAGNTAIQLDAEAYLSVADPGENSDFDFSNGDAITIEAWVSPTQVRPGQPLYIIGKGRTGSPNFSRDNQNWALRIVCADGQAQLSFLFATKLSSSDRHWHRWTSTARFPILTGWHHLAVAYRFGQADSIRGWINGKPTGGRWDMGGPTEQPPIVDDDEVRIGSRFAGLLDAVAIHRAVLDDDVIAARFRRVGEQRVVELQPQVMPDLGSIPEGRVLFQLGEGMPTNDRWLYQFEQWPQENLRWLGDAFLLPRLPLQYDAWGIRSRWRAPLLLRIAGDLELPIGEQQVLVRARSLGRLWIDGKLIAETKPNTVSPPNGEERMTPLPQPPVPGARPHGYHQQEVFGTAVIQPNGHGPTRRCRVVLELVVGGRNRRTETGEVCVALRASDHQSYHVLTGRPVTPNSATEKLVAGSCGLPLTDAAVAPVLEEIERSLADLDDSRRRAAAATQDSFWDRRHRLARQAAAADPAYQSGWGLAGREPSVDAFIESKLHRALTAAAATDSRQAERFHHTVLPILRDNCFRCHGDKAKGGLKLDSRQAAVRGGESEIPAVVAGDLEASELITRIRSDDEGVRMPPTGPGLTRDEIETLEQWVQGGAAWPDPPVGEHDVAFAPLTDDEAFLRRVYLDTIGLPPTADEIRDFVSNPQADRRDRVIETLLADQRIADHLMADWLDWLAENPTLINASLNSTGPFRWFLYDSLRDRKPLDRMVTELLMMRGSAADGGSAGFGLAGENDAPLAAKGHILASAFLGIELQCARCHDSPYHSTTQQDLYSLAAMLARKSVTVPKSSRVPQAFFEAQKARKSLIQVTLDAGQSVPPQWPFAAATGVHDTAAIDELMDQPSDTRERLAALVTAPQSDRFPAVIVNRLWHRLMGAGLVEPVDDWEGKTASHPELLSWLTFELVTHDYDLLHITRLILASQAYQRVAAGKNHSAPPERRFFQAPDRRRLTAEQIVDSLHYSTGNRYDVEELTFVHDGRRPLSNRQTLGRPRRAWMLADLKNERDRPSLSLPKARSVVDVLEAFGWIGARQMPITRDREPQVLQPGVLANGSLTNRLTRAAHGSTLAELAIAADSPAALVDELFLRILGRHPRPDEQQEFSMALADHFDRRLVPEDQVDQVDSLPALPLVTWFNHLRPRANQIQLEHERRVQAGPPRDPRLLADWADVYEDIVWSLFNHSEFVWVP